MVTPWLKLLGKGAPDPPMLHISLKRTGSVLKKAKAEVRCVMTHLLVSLRMSMCPLVTFRAHKLLSGTFTKHKSMLSSAMSCAWARHGIRGRLQAFASFLPLHNSLPQPRPALHRCARCRRHTCMRTTSCWRSSGTPRTGRSTCWCSTPGRWSRRWTPCQASM